MHLFGVWRTDENKRDSMDSFPLTNPGNRLTREPSKNDKQFELLYVLTVDIRIPYPNILNLGNFYLLKLKSALKPARNMTSKQF